jgi:hypothetical protein
LKEDYQPNPVILLHADNIDLFKSAVAVFELFRMKNPSIVLTLLTHFLLSDMEQETFLAFGLKLAG